MITKNDWIVELIENHFIMNVSISRKEMEEIFKSAEDKIKFKESLE